MRKLIMVGVFLVVVQAVAAAYLLVAAYGFAQYQGWVR